VTAAIGRLSTSITTRYPLTDLLGVRLPLALLLCVPLFAPQVLPGTRLLSLAVTCAIYVVVANGLHVIFSYNGQLSLAHTSLWGVGAYVAALMITHYDTPMLLLLPIAGISGAIAAVMIGVPAFRTGGFSFAIITFAFAEIMRLIANNWVDVTKGSLGITVFDSPESLFGISFDTFDHLDHFYYLVLAFAYLSVVAVWTIRYSRLGKTFVSIRENEALARSLGVNTYLYKIGAFALSGVFAGAAGVFFVYHQKHIEPGPLSPFGAFYTIQFLLMILIGGRLSVLGPTIGALVVVFGPEVVNAILGDVITTQRAQIIFGSTLALSVLSAPAGIAGQTRRGYHVFFTALRRERDHGRGWPRSFATALARSIVPAGFED
jgi:branched-chain amino acid transport system permease protein